VVPGAPLTDPAGTGVTGVTFSPDGTLLAVGDMNGRAYLWDPVYAVLAEPPVRYEPDAGEVGSIALSSANMLAIGRANGTAGDITLWNAQTSSYIKTLSDPGGSGAPGRLAFSLDGTYLVAGDGNGAVYLWNVYLDRPAATLRGPGTGKISDVAFQAGSHTFAVADGSSSVSFWEAANRVRLGGMVQVPDGASVQALSFSPDGTLLATGDADGNVYLWSMATGKLQQTLHDPQGLPVSDVAFSPDGTALVAAGNNPAHTVSAIRVWKLATQQLYTFHDPHSAGALHLAFSPDGSLLAVGDGNGNTYLWGMLWLNG
jgi:WD40 repeat protein